MSFTDPEESQREPEQRTDRQREAGKVLSFAHRDPAEWPQWACPGCGEEMCHPQGMPAEPMRRLCYDCAEACRASRIDANDRKVLLAKAGVPAKFLADFAPPASWPYDARAGNRAALDSWKGSPWCIVLQGPSRTGKTFLGTELFWRNLQRAESASWWRATLAIDHLLGNFGRADREDCQRRLYRDRLVMVDDFGREARLKARADAEQEAGDRAWSLISEMLIHRNDHGLATIITTNRALNRKTGVEESINERDSALYRRLCEGLIVWMPDDWRAPTDESEGESRRKPR